jgi:hypothetical protein
MSTTDREKEHKLRTDLWHLQNRLRVLYDAGADEIRLSSVIGLVLKLYLLICVVAICGTAVYQESINPIRPLNIWIRGKLGHNDFHDFLATHSRV